MVVPAMALYASPPSSVCSTPHQFNAYSAYDFDLLNSSSSSSSTAASSSSVHKPIMGGLSCLFSSSTVKHVASSSSFCGDMEDLGSLWHERVEELKEFKSGSKCFGVSSLKRDHQSPVSVFQAPFSCSPSSSVSGSSPLRIGHGGGANGFVRHALGSCVEYDSRPLRIVDGIDVVAGGGSDELTFSMEDVFMESKDRDPLVETLLVDAQSRHKIFSEEIVIKAFYEAEKAHRGQTRASGDPYLKHCVETAILLAMIGANSAVVAAGLLHDTFDDSFLSYDYLFRTFGPGVADLVKGVSKLSQLSKLARDNNTASRTAEADRLHTMFLAMADARAVLIKLADRLHNMMTLEALPLIKQLRFAKETLEIFAPLANRLGISTWKEQLENLCFKHLNPDQHKELSSRLEETFDVAMITTATEKLEQALRDEAISYHVLHGRHKSLYSIYCKMLKKKLNVDEILDIHGLRLIVENEKDCYRALKVVHQLWSQVPGKFKDYIIYPKFNGYQSLHTVVIGEGRVPLEVQIRTKQMHLQAEIGFAAHWRYKEGDSKHSSFVLQMVEWARWVITWQCETMAKDQSSSSYTDSVKPPCAFPLHSEDCPFSYKPGGQDGPVFVIMIENEKMSVQEFPGNSTVMDLLVRAGRGSPKWPLYQFPVKEELRPRVNHVPVSDPTCKLKMGDVVELAPAIPDKSLMVYREEIQRMYNHGLSTVSSTPPVATRMVGWSS